MEKLSAKIFGYGISTLGSKALPILRQIDGKIVCNDFWLWNFRPKNKSLAEIVDLTKKSSRQNKFQSKILFSKLDGNDDLRQKFREKRFHK